LASKVPMEVEKAVTGNHYGDSDKRCDHLLLRKDTDKATNKFDQRGSGLVHILQCQRTANPDLDTKSDSPVAISLVYSD